MRGSANNKKETMRLWRENGCWSNDAGITSSLLSLLLPLCLLSLSCSPSVFFSSLLHISVFLCPALIFQVISSSATQQRQGQVKNHSKTIFFSTPFLSLEPRPQRKSFLVHILEWIRGTCRPRRHWKSRKETQNKPLRDAKHQIQMLNYHQEIQKQQETYNQLQSYPKRWKRNQSRCKNESREMQNGLKRDTSCTPRDAKQPHRDAQRPWRDADKSWLKM